MIEPKFLKCEFLLLDAMRELDKVLNNKFYKGINYSNPERMELIADITSRALLEYDKKKESQK